MHSLFNGARGYTLALPLVVLCSMPEAALAQTPPTDPLPTIVVEESRARPPARRRAPRVEPATAPAPATADAAASPSEPSAGVPSQALLTAQQALAQINRTPGGVAHRAGRGLSQLAPSPAPSRTCSTTCPACSRSRNGATTRRLSIRGSGLSRNFHLRGVQLYMDGIPINTADGYGDFQEIDPTAYKYVEVFKGANALQFGANSLGGAINFVTPSGRDPLAQRRLARSSARSAIAGCRPMPAASTAPWDGYLTASTQAADGFRDHSDGHATRVSGNVGYQISPDIETRFYLNANEVRQRIPGSRDQDRRR